MVTKPEQFTGLPFVAGSIRGERCWTVENDQLWSPQYPYVWVDGENVGACQSVSRNLGLRQQLMWDLAQELLGPDRQILSLQRSVYQSDAFTVDWETKQRRVVMAPSPQNPPFYADPSVQVAEVVDEGGTTTIRWAGLDKVLNDLMTDSGPHDLSSCTCGFYGYLNGDNDYEPTSPVVGIIEGYGETYIGTRGFRAKKARILAIAPSDEHHESRLTRMTTFTNHHGHIRSTVSDKGVNFSRLAENYPSVRIFGSVDEMRAEFPATRIDEIDS